MPLRGKHDERHRERPTTILGYYRLLTQMGAEVAALLAAHDPTLLGRGPSLRDLKSTDENLEGTYSALPAANSDELSPVNVLSGRLERLGFGRAIRSVNRDIASTNPAVSDASRARSR